MMKSIIASIAFTVTFGFSVVLVGLIFGFPQTDRVYKQHESCHINDQSEIVSFLARDVRYGDLRDSDLRSFDSAADLPLVEYTEFINKYVAKSQAMDDEFLPKDFQYAWRNHMKAWRDYADFLSSLSSGTVDASSQDFVSLEKEYNSEITRTWNLVLEIGENHQPGLRSKLGQ